MVIIRIIKHESSSCYRTVVKVTVRCVTDMENKTAWNYCYKYVVQTHIYLFISYPLTQEVKLVFKGAPTEHTGREPGHDHIGRGVS